MTQTQAYGYCLLRSLLISGVLFASPLPAMAQRIPVADDTLGDERSIVSPDEVIRDVPSNRIDGGARRGANLFHSFKEFNIEEGRGAYFSNPDGVENILTRVTGNNRSDILGTLGVLGNADLFLINPNGIVFGPNARLDVAGSFVSSTANGFVFDNGFIFSATDPQAPPLLTVSAPIGLQYGANPRAIRVQGTSLEMPEGQTLTLAGGTVSVVGGELLVPGGRVELAGVSAPGEVGLSQQGQEWRLSLPQGLARADVSLTNGAFVDVRAGGGGNIAINARNVNILGDGSKLYAGIAEGLGSVGAVAGDININATQAVNVAVGGGIAGGFYNFTWTGTVGDSGDVNITTRTLTVTGDGARVESNVYGMGNGGDVIINARDSVTFDGDVAAVGTLEETGKGNGGDIIITTGSLRVLEGAGLNASTYGEGNGGSVIISTRDSVTIDGVSSRYGFSTGISTFVAETADGVGGNIIITTGSLRVTGGGALSANTNSEGNGGNLIVNARDTVIFDGVARNGVISRATSNVTETGNGNGGEINITTGVLQARGGAFLSTSTSGQGNAGNITIAASDTVSIDGVDSNGFPGGVFSTVESGAEGRGGRIRVSTGRFSITNGAELSASSDGQGRAGDLEVNARQLRLNQGSIVAETRAGQGGDMMLQVPDLLLLQQGSLISTTAGTAQAGGDGGNIAIDGNFIVAAPNENNDISANAFSGRGGNVEINAQSLFGIEARLQPTPLSDITASSETGVAGIVSINTPDVDPNRGLVQLPVEVTDASRLIVQTCPSGGNSASQQNEFIVTGRGGLPPTLDEAVNPNAIQVDLVTTDAEAESSVSQDQSEQDRPPIRPTLSDGEPIVEAQGWQVGADGKVMLVAAAPEPAIDSAASERSTSPANSLIHCP